jgi:outer membrane protein assembly factor BamB
LKDWPSAGPKVKWKITNLGAGDCFSAPAVANGRIYLLTIVGRDEFVTALDEKDGSKIWSTKMGGVGKNPGGGNDYSGPRSTPTVDGDKIYALSSGGDLVCLKTEKGELIWRKSLSGDFSGKPGNWAYTESPLVDGDVVVVTPGGTSATVVALKKNDGAVLWKSAVPGKGGKGGPSAAYGSVIRADVGDIKQYVSVLNSGIVGVSASDGKFLWRFDKPSNKQGINIPTPVFHDGIIFNNSGYSSGGGAAKLSVDNGKVSAKELWFETDLTSAQAVCGFVRVGEHIYGTGLAGKGGMGGGGTGLLCVELKTGKILWKNTSVGDQGSLCFADGMFYVRGQNGRVLLVEANPMAYKEHGKFTQAKTGKRPTWPYPVVANGCLYLRDLGTMVCYDIRDSKGK